jgi:hypothetical protein
MFGEFEAYGYMPSILLGVPADLTAEVADGKVSLSWTAAANAASYKVYRKLEGGDWTIVASDLSGVAYTDTTVERGKTYIYRVAAVSAVGDERSSSDSSASMPAGAPVWWNFLNVKSIAYPGAAAWPANPRPHFLSRDRAGTTLMAAMSTDSGALPVMTFDLQALVDGYGELLSRETKAKAWWIWGKDAYAPWQNEGFCWKGAAATADLIFWANGTSADAVAVVSRTDDSEATYVLRDASGNAYQFHILDANQFAEIVDFFVHGSYHQRIGYRHHGEIMCAIASREMISQSGQKFETGIILIEIHFLLRELTGQIEGHCRTEAEGPCLAFSQIEVQIQAYTG